MDILRPQLKISKLELHSAAQMQCFFNWKKSSQLLEKGISKHKTLLSFGHWKFTVVHLCRYAVQAKEDGEGDVFYCHFTGVRELEKGKK